MTSLGKGLGTTAACILGGYMAYLGHPGYGIMTAISVSYIIWY